VIDEDKSHGLNGLDENQVLERIKQGKVNNIVQKTSRTFAEIFRANVFTLFNALLSSLLIIIILVGSVNDALFGFAFIANSLIGIIQEVRAKRTLDRLSLINTPEARVIRGGRQSLVPFNEVVLDDVIELYPGDQVVVDGVVLSSESLEIDEAFLTGESIPVYKNAGDTLYSGSYSVAGTGKFRVMKVGDETYAQKLATEARRFSITHSEIKEGINTFLKWISWGILPLAVLLFYSQQKAGLPVQTSAVATVAAMIGMIPQGLVLLTSLTFAVSVITLGRLKVLVQELPAVEVFARVDVICFDKTGTLTDGTLAISDIVQLMPDDGTEKALGAISGISAFQNPTTAAISASFTAPEDWDITGMIPFSSERKWSAASFGEHGNWFLGAPEILIAHSSHDDRIDEQISDCAERGFRVLLLARSQKSVESDILPEDLIPVALVLFMEKVRSDVSDAIKYFDKEGVAIKIISGDNPATTLSVANRAGITNVGNPFDARLLPEDKILLADVMEEHTVFGRVTPHQKQSMVEALRSKGHVVAMVGDGVNDVLALKDADIGIAMGSGVAATKAIARIVLLDGELATLPVIVAEGRRTIANIERVANLYLTKTVCIVILAIAIAMIGLPYPFLPRHLSIAGVLTIGVPSFFLALAPNLRRYSPGFISRIMTFVIPLGIIEAIGILISFVTAEKYSGSDMENSWTIATIALVSISLWVLIIIARPLTKLRVGLIAIIILSIAMVIAVPYSRTFFALNLPPFDLLIQAGIIILITIGIIELVWGAFIKKRIAEI